MSSVVQDDQIRLINLLISLEKWHDARARRSADVGNAAWRMAIIGEGGVEPVNGQAVRQLRQAIAQGLWFGPCLASFLPTSDFI